MLWMTTSSPVAPVFMFLADAVIIVLDVAVAVAVCKTHALMNRSATTIITTKATTTNNYGEGDGEQQLQ